MNRTQRIIKFLGGAGLGLLVVGGTAILVNLNFLYGLNQAQQVTFLTNNPSFWQENVNWGIVAFIGLLMFGYCIYNLLPKEH